MSMHQDNKKVDVLDDAVNEDTGPNTRHLRGQACHRRRVHQRPSVLPRCISVTEYCRTPVDVELSDS